MAQRSGDPVSALKFAKLGLQRLYEHSAPTPTTEAAYLSVIADAECANGRNDEAEKYFQRALDQLSAVGRDRSPVAMTVLNSWSVMSEAAGNPRRALELTERSLRITAQSDPNSTPAPYVVGTKAHVLHALGRVRESRYMYSECVDDKAPRVRVFCLSGLALASNDLGEFDKADSYVQAAFEAEAAIVPTDGVMLAKLRAIRGRIALSQGRLAAARTDLDSAIANSSDMFILMPALLPRVELDLLEGRSAAAEADARRLLTLTQRTQGGIRYSNRTGLAWLALGRALSNEGNVPESAEASGRRSSICRIQWMRITRCCCSHGSSREHESCRDRGWQSDCQGTAPRGHHGTPQLPAIENRSPHRGQPRICVSDTRVHRPERQAPGSARVAQDRF